MGKKFVIGYRYQIKLIKTQSVLIAVDENQSDHNLFEAVFTVSRNLFNTIFLN